jgi:signal peptidase I
MENTLLEDEVLILDKISYNFSKPDRGDIVVFLLDESSTGIINRFSVFFNDISLKLSGGYRSDRLVKRVIGIPGDEIDIQNGSLYVNGAKQSELYVKTITEKAIIELPVTVPEGYVFVLGDNRMVSKDSRHFGLIDIKNIEGKIILRASPLSKFGKP